MRFSPLVIKVLEELEVHTPDDEVHREETPSMDSRDASRHDDMVSEHQPADVQITRAEMITQTESMFLQPVHCIIPTISFQYTDENDMVHKLDAFLRSHLFLENSTVTGQRVTVSALDSNTEREQNATLLDLRAWRKDLQRELMP